MMHGPMHNIPPLAPQQSFRWPSGRRAAVSISFDDARPCQLDNAMPILNRHGVKATFYVTLSTMMKRLDDWKAITHHGHEIGNHSTRHPCSGNFLWSRGNALEEFTLESMAADIDNATEQITEHFGAKPRTFAYPCGQTFVNRGAHQRSYVPLIADRFIVGRGFNNEFITDPAYCDLASVSGIDLDCKTIEQVMAGVTAAADTGAWLIFAGHSVNTSGPQTVATAVLDELCRYCTDPANGIWIDTVAAVGEYVQDIRLQSPLQS